MKRGEARKLIAQAIAKGQYDGQTWRTINGTDVQIGDDGQIINGPAGLKEWAANGGTKGGGKSSSGGHKIANGSDIFNSWKGGTDINEVLKAQGFDGPPKIVGKDEFDEAVKASNFIAQRTYSASSEEILKEYQDMLYDGEFYVDCSEGGSQYGKGMYCAADYNGELTNGIKEEMDHYKELGTDRTQWAAQLDYITGLRADDFNSISWMKDDPLTQEQVSAYTHEQARKKEWQWGMDQRADLSESEKDVIATMKTTKDSVGSSYYSDAELALDTLVSDWKDTYVAPSVTETMTLDPSAKIITSNELRNLKAKAGNDDVYNYDDGAYAALLGYDAINAEHHGESGSYTVVLNRTKLILQDNRIVSKAEGQVRMSRMTFEPGDDGRMNAVRDGKVIGWVFPFGSDDGKKKDSKKSQGKTMKKSEAQQMVNKAVEKATATLARKDSKGRTLPQFMEYEEMEAELDRNEALIKKSSGAERRDLVNRNFDLQSEMDWRWAKSQGSLSSFKNKKEGES